MTDDTNTVAVELSRRNVLGAMGTLGAAGALGGAGTAAFFSDEEQFENNTLVAGSLDLKVDWQEHYVDWLGAEREVARMPGENEDPDFVLPGDPNDPNSRPIELVFENGYGIEDLKERTAVEAYPDGLDIYNGGGVGADPNAQDGLQDEVPEGMECEVLGSIDDPTDPVLSSDLRTQGTFAGQTTEPGDDLIDITDVKPGDFGEVTLSFHLCDNPGWVWLKGNLDAANTTDGNDPDPIEPSWNDPDEDASEGGDTVELLDEIRCRAWMDDGDNILENGETVLFDNRSLREALGLLRFDPANGEFGIPLGPDDGNGGFDPLPGPGTCSKTAYDEVNTGTEEFPNGSMREQMNPKCGDFGLTEAIKINAGDLPDTGSCKTYETEYGDLQVCRDSDGTITSWETDASPDGSFDQGEDGFCVSKVIVKGGNQGANIYHYDRPSPLSSGDTGSFVTPTGQDYSHVSVCVDESGDGGNGGNGERECFVNSTTYYVGFEWWLPLDHANEVQGDQVQFDIGFYTEQCRHNDGSGQPPETTPPNG